MPTSTENYLTHKKEVQTEDMGDFYIILGCFNFIHFVYFDYQVSGIFPSAKRSA